MKKIYLILFVAFIFVIIFAWHQREENKPSGVAPRKINYELEDLPIQFSYPVSWGEIEVLPGNSLCPEEDTYRTPETLSIFDKEYKFRDQNLPSSDSFIRRGVRVYRMNPNKMNNCNDEILRQLARKEITGEEFSSFQLWPINIPPFYGVHNENASRLDTEGRDQYTFFLEESPESVVVIQPYFSFIPFYDSPEWKEIDASYQNNILSYIKEGKTANSIRTTLNEFRALAESIASKK
jgi:hypothetical protein